ncbi:hypothetical protein NQZ79_g701 [Umbelopsis isabellina]|nr:hypothetical protein NQZ79_g701 [Umbelopsis isabellina]
MYVRAPITRLWHRNLPHPLAYKEGSRLFYRLNHSDSRSEAEKPLNNVEQKQPSEEEQVSYKPASSFPWVLSNEEPRIPAYPYPLAPNMWSLLNYLPTFAQREMSKYLGTRMLRLNTGFSYFPEQFLIGATLATRKAFEILSLDLASEKEEKSQSAESVFSPVLLQRLRDARSQVDPDARFNISIPQIYDATIKDVWITLGSPQAFQKNRQYEIMQWMTLTIGVKAARQNEDEEAFSDYRGRIAKGLMDGAHFKVDVEIDADVEYKVSKSKSTEGDQDNSVLLYDRGRRPLIISFETPYFEPADRMVAGRDEDDEPIMDWSWRISDIDQLLAKEDIDSHKA